MTLTTPSLIHTSTSTATDLHAHHRREALALHRARRRARRRLTLTKLLAAVRPTAAPLEIPWRDVETSAVGSGGGVDL